MVGLLLVLVVCLWWTSNCTKSYVDLVDDVLREGLVAHVELLEVEVLLVLLDDVLQELDDVIVDDVEVGDVDVDDLMVA